MGQTNHQLQPLLAHLTPSNFKRLSDSWQSKVSLTDANQVKALIFLNGYLDLQFFTRYFFYHHCKASFSRMHLDFFQDEVLPRRRGERQAIAAPRGHAKTTIKLLVKAIHAIVYGYEPFILVIGQSSQEAQDKVQQILDELTSNDRLIGVFGQLAPVRGGKNGMARGGKGGFTTSTGVRVLAKSRDQQVRGIKHGASRPSLIIADDIETLEGVQNPVQRLKTKNWWLKDVLKCGQTDGSTNIILIGTCLHTESLLSELLVTPGWAGRKYQAVERFSDAAPLWEQWKSIYTDLANPTRDSDAQNFYEQHEEDLLAGTQVLWPDGEPYLQLMKQLVSEGAAAFHSEKQNEPYDPERQLFRMDQAKRFTLEEIPTGGFNLVWQDDSKRVIPHTDLVRIIAFHDPALGEKPGKQSDVDFAAIVVVANDVHGYLYVLDATIEKSTPSQQIEAAFRLHDRWHLSALYLESNHFQDLLRHVYHDAQEKRPDMPPLRVIGVHQHSNKIQRISTLEPDITNGHLLFSAAINPRLLQQLTLFPTTHDDGPDALHGAVTQLKKRIDTGVVAAPVTTGQERPTGFPFHNPFA